MRLHKSLKAVALLTALCILLTATVPAFAADETTTVYATGGDQKKVEGSVLIPEGVNSSGAEVNSNENEKTALEVTGNVKSGWAAAIIKAWKGISSLLIGGNTNAKNKYNATAISSDATEGGRTDATVNGSVTAESEERNATGISVNAIGIFDHPEKASTAKVTVGKDVTTTGANEVYGITGSSTFGSELTIEAGGSVSAESQKSNANALIVSTTGEKSKATVTVAGDVAASGNENVWNNTTGIRITNRGGEANAIVTGDVKSTRTGISTTTEKYSTSFSLTQQEIEAIKDKLILVNDNGNRKYYSYTDENGDQYEYYEYNDGYSYGYKRITREYAGTTSVTVGGNVVAENDKENHSVTGVSANSNVVAQETVITVGSDVTAKGNGSATGVVGEASNGGVTNIDISKGTVTVESEAGSTTGVSMNSNGSVDDPEKVSTAKLVVGKDVTAKGKYDATGVVGKASNGGVTNIDISKGAITAESKESSATGVSMNANGSFNDPEKASTAKVTVGKDVTVTGAKSVYGITGSSTFGSELTIEAAGSITVESENKKADALTISTTGENSKATVTVAGDVSASGNENYWNNNSTGIDMMNNGGEATATVTGDVKSTGTGISTTTEKYSTSFSLTQQEIEAIKDKLILVNDNGNRKYYSYTDENGDQYKYYEYNDGYSYGYKYINREYAGTTSVTVGGNVVAENNGENRSVTGISAYNQVKDQKTDITVGGDVTAKGNSWTAGIVNETSNGGVTNIDISKGTVTVESEAGSTTGVSMNSNGSVDDPEKVSTAKLTVGKDVTAKGKYDATGVVGKASNGGVTNIDISKGAITAESKESSATGVSMNANGSFNEPEKASTAKVTVGKDVTATGKYYTYGITGSSTFGSEVTIEADGSVTAESKEYGSEALILSTIGEKSKATATVAGDVTANGNNDYWDNTYGIRMTNYGGKASATVTGDVKSTGTGIYATSEQYYYSYSLTQQEIEAIKDKLTLDNEDEYGKYYSYTDENGDQYTYYEYNTGNTYGYKSITREYAGTTNVTAGGNVVAENEEENQSVTGISANNQVNGQATDITVGGDVTAKGNGSAKGVVGKASNGGITNIDISKGAVIAESEESGATGVSMNANGSFNDPEKASTAKVTVGKDVTVTGAKNVYGITGSSTFGSELTIEAGGSITAESENKKADALTISTTGENSKATVTVAGDVSASGNGDYWENAYAIRMTNYGGDATATVTDDVKSTGTGIYATSGLYNSSYYLDQQEIEAIKDKLTLVDNNENWKYYSYTDESGDQYDYYEYNYNDRSICAYRRVIKDYKYTTNVSVGGNVVAENDEGYQDVRGIIANNQVKDQKTDITVGGDITAKGNGSAMGVEGVASDSGVMNIDISKGSVSVESKESSATGVSMSANNSFFNPSTVKLMIGKDVSVKGKGNATGVVGNASNDGVTDIDISKGSVSVESKESNATGVSMSANGSFVNPSTVKLMIGKDVSVKGKGNATGVVGNASNDGVIDIDISKGAVTVESKESSATGIRMNANGSFGYPEKASTAKLVVGKDVTATGKYYTYGITGSSTFGSEVTIEADGSITAESENGRGYGLRISTTGEKSKATATVAGDVAASGNENGTTGIGMTNIGGEATATVTGDVKSTGTGISTTTEKYSTSFSLTQQEIEAIKDKLILVNDNGNRKYYSYTDENGDQYKYYEYNDGYSYGYKYINREYAGITSVTVGGNVVAENNGVNRSVTGISAYNQVKDQKTDITVGGDVTAKGNSWTAGIVNETSNGGVTNIDISKGTVTVESEAGSTTGVSMNANGSFDDPEKVSTAKLTVGKDVTAKGKYDATGVAGKASNGSEVKIEVGGNVNAESENGSANALTISTTGENSKATATVAGNVTASGNGDYWENAYAIRMTNYGGEAIATITGDVKSTGIGVSAYSQQYQTSFSLTEQEIAAIKDKLILVMDNEDGKYYSYTAENGDRYEYYEYNDGSSYGYKNTSIAYESETRVTVGGNVSAQGDNNPVGIEADNHLSDEKASCIYILVEGTVSSDGNGIVVKSRGDRRTSASKDSLLGEAMVTILDDVTAKGVGISIWDGQNTSVLVDGTVSGEEFPVSLGQNIDTDSLILTVWAIEPDENGVVVGRRDGWDSETKKWKYAEDEDVEANVQYIIRVEQPEKGGTLYTEGTTEYQGYDVAHEGDTVYLKAELKPGFRIVKAFYDTEKTLEMQKEGNNVFSMVVPRGGAVSLSALLSNFQKPVSERPANPVYTENANYDKYVAVDRNESNGAKVTVKINGNGGTINGKASNTLLISAGKTVLLPEVDEREGVEFLGWYASKCDRNSKDWVEPAADAQFLPSNTEVKVMEKTVFTAIWKTKSR